MTVSSDNMKQYFEKLEAQVQYAHSIAKQARKENFDPDTKVEIKLAKNLAERVVGLISVLAPQIVDTPIVDRIVELEAQYGNQDWRVAMIIAHEVAEQTYCQFKDTLEAIEVGIRIGFAYVTVGVVSSPLEGFTKLELVDTLDKKGKYFAMHFAGPIRNAGGTAAATSVIIADYVRKKMGYLPYDPTNEECERCFTEIMDYHDRVTNLQYVPSKEESLFMVKHCPIEISGDASERFDVSNFKDLPRVHTNKIRSGFCLIHSSCLPLKAPKLWKNLSRWHKEMDMEDWQFLEEFIHIQHLAKAKAKGLSEKKKTNADQPPKEEPKITPVYTYIADLVGGRPVISHPLRSGGLRLRYGRSRVSGFSAQSVHPATMYILDDFMAIGTQFKVERPGKAAAFTSCDTIEGPRVELEDGTILLITNVQQALQYRSQIKRILYVGDVLINYGDFFDRAHPLIPSGYCEEWWALELQQAIENNTTTQQSTQTDLTKDITNEQIQQFITQPLYNKPTYTQAKILSLTYNIPLHPSFIYFYNEVTPQQLQALAHYCNQHQWKETLPFDATIHNTFALLGIPLQVENNTIILNEETKTTLQDTLQPIVQTQPPPTKTNTQWITQHAPFTIMDKSGTFIGARMGRPEKGKIRKMQTSPHGLFPVGEQGGRMRSFDACAQTGFVQADCAVYYDEALKGLSVLARSHISDKPNTKVFINANQQRVEEKTPDAKTHTSIKIPFPEIYEYCIKKLGMHVPPDLVKGVQGTVNEDHYCEHPIKAILRAHHDIFVNKDGTIRYDASELPITHFRPREIRTSVKKLNELGYTHDIDGKPLTNENQMCEIIPQDVLLPCCTVAPFEAADTVLFRATKFIDDLLTKVYGLPSYYNLQTPDDLAGQLVIGLAPHTSAGTVGRIIGFSQSQAMFCHPLYHSAMRRDADGDESCYLLLMDAFLNFSTKYLPSSRGGTMDAPLVLTSILEPSEVDDMVFNMDVAFSYPLELYQAAQEYKMPWDVKVSQLKSRLHTPQQFEGFGFTHNTNDINDGVLCSSYKTLPSMQDKVQAQMRLAEKIRAVDQSDVARIVIQTHFIRDTRGNLRKYSMQEFRCVKCNTKYRRPPLRGTCIQEGCGGKLLFTIAQGSIIKYLEPSLQLAYKYAVSPYLRQSLELTRLHIDGVFGKDKEKQTGLGDWF